MLHLLSHICIELSIDSTLSKEPLAFLMINFGADSKLKGHKKHQKHYFVCYLNYPLKMIIKMINETSSMVYDLSYQLIALIEINCIY